MKSEICKALILVDIQNDFIPGGALAVAGGDEVIPIANEMAAKFELVVATQDFHPADHQSFASQHASLSVGEVFDLSGQPQIAWPDHCVEGTPGADFADSLDLDSVTRVFKKGRDCNIDSYSGFFDNDHRSSTGLGEYLNQQHVTDVYVMGLATDYCVKFTAIDAAELGFKTWLIKDGCRGVEMQPGDIDQAISEMAAANVSLINSKDIA